MKIDSELTEAIIIGMIFLYVVMSAFSSLISAILLEFLRHFRTT